MFATSSPLPPPLPCSRVCVCCSGAVPLVGSCGGKPLIIHNGGPKEKKSNNIRRFFFHLRRPRQQRVRRVVLPAPPPTNLLPPPSVSYLVSICWSTLPPPPNQQMIPRFRAERQRQDEQAQIRYKRALAAAAAGAAAAPPLPLPRSAAHQQPAAAAAAAAVAAATAASRKRRAPLPSPPAPPAAKHARVLSAWSSASASSPSLAALSAPLPPPGFDRRLPCELLSHVLSYLPLFPHLAAFLRLSRAAHAAARSALHWAMRERARTLVLRPAPSQAAPPPPPPPPPPSSAASTRAPLCAQQRTHLWAYAQAGRCALCFARRPATVSPHLGGVVLSAPVRCHVCAVCLGLCFEAGASSSSPSSSPSMRRRQQQRRSDRIRAEGGRRYSLRLDGPRRAYLTGVPGFDPLGIVPMLALSLEDGA